MSTTSTETPPAGACPRSASVGQAASSLPSIHADSFTRWRPQYHLIATSGWMNDPCGLGHDPKSGLYHVAFQWNPNGNDWGDIAWGSAVSRDLVLWRVSSTACIKPGSSYDHRGVFSGCLVRPGLAGADPNTLTYFYTSVSHLPIHYTLPYVYGSESLSMATSQDGGWTWTKHYDNPILPGPPPGLDVTAWRDPFVSTWPALSKHLGYPEHTLFGCIAGGISGQSPTATLYSIDPTDLTAWTYKGLLAYPGLNKRLSRWSGDFGVNWEVVNFLTVTDNLKQVSISVIIMGCEGCLPESISWAIKSSGSKAARRTIRAQLWASGSFQRSTQPGGQDSLMSIDFGGVFDHGCLYAANSFWDPAVGGNVVMGWVAEEDIPDELRHMQGWSGCLSLPRLLSVVTMKRVTGARVSVLHDITSVQAVADEDGTFTITTLGIEPHPNLSLLRQSATLLELESFHLVSSVLGSSLHQPAIDARSLCWEFETQLAISPDCRRAGFEIAHSAGEKNIKILYNQPHHN